MKTTQEKIYKINTLHYVMQGRFYIPRNNFSHLNLHISQKKTTFAPQSKKDAH